MQEILKKSDIFQVFSLRLKTPRWVLKVTDNRPYIGPIGPISGMHNPAPKEFYPALEAG